MENNMDKWNARKTAKYASIAEDITTDQTSATIWEKVVVVAFEVGALGGVNNTLPSFLNSLEWLTKREVRETVKKCGLEALSASHFIWNRRHDKTWTHDHLGLQEAAM